MNTHLLHRTTKNLQENAPMENLLPVIIWIIVVIFVAIKNMAQKAQKQIEENQQNQEGVSDLSEKPLTLADRIRERAQVLIEDLLEEQAPPLVNIKSGANRKEESSNRQQSGSKKLTKLEKASLKRKKTPPSDKKREPTETLYQRPYKKTPVEKGISKRKKAVNNYVGTDLQKAVIWSEILGKPMAMREEIQTK